MPCLYGYSKLSHRTMRHSERFTVIRLDCRKPSGLFGGAVLTASIYPDCVLTVTLVQLRQCIVASEFFSEMCLACMVKAIKVFVERGGTVIEIQRSG